MLGVSILAHLFVQQNGLGGKVVLWLKMLCQALTPLGDYILNSLEMHLPQLSAKNT